MAVGCLTRALSGDKPAHLVGVVSLMADPDMDRGFTLGLDLIVTGLEARR